MAIPKSFVEENLSKAEGAMIFDVPLEGLTKQEMISCIVAGRHAERSATEEGARRIGVIAGLRS